MNFDSLISTASHTANRIKDTINAAQDFCDSVKESAKAMTPELISQLKQCKDTYSALKMVISGVIQDIHSPKDIQGWATAFDNFDKKWDVFAKEATSLYEALSHTEQTKILETFARNNLGDAVFDAGSAIKNNSSDILKGIIDFKGAVSEFGGSYRNLVVATSKIRNGVAGIVSATEKIAASSEKIIKGLAGLNGKTLKGIPVLSQLSKLSSYKAVAGTLTVLNTSFDGINIYTESRQLSQCIKNGDFTGAISIAEQMYGNIKKIVTLTRKNEAVDSLAKKIIDAVNSNRNAQSIKSAWNIGATGLYSANAAVQLMNDIKEKDLRGAYASGKILVNNVKSIVAEIHNIAEGQKAGTYVSPVKALQGKSSSVSSSGASVLSSGVSYTYVCSGAKLKCTCGDSIATLTVLPSRTINLYGQPMANITDHISMVNVSSFGKCRTITYPPTGSATAANHGKLTPMPCVPGTKFIWMKGKVDVLLKGEPALLSSSVLKCIYGGTITIVFDGQNV